MNQIQDSRQRVVLITGASSGFGQACAQLLSQKDYRVFGTSRNASFNDQTNRDNANASPFQMIPMDVQDQSSVETGMDYIFKQTGRIDIVINNAGIAIAGSIEDTSIDEFKIQFETNFFGTVRLCHAVLPHMRKQQVGYIVNIGSLAGVIGLPFQGVYSASKHALEGLTEALRMEVKPFGICVSLIEPGDFKTSITQNRIFTTASKHNSAYTEKFQTALSLMEKSEMAGPSPDKLAVLVEKIINHPSPKVRYTIGNVDQKLSALLKRLVPASVFEKIMMKYYQIT